MCDFSLVGLHNIVPVHACKSILLIGVGMGLELGVRREERMKSGEGRGGAIEYLKQNNALLILLLITSEMLSNLNLYE